MKCDPHEAAARDWLKRWVPEYTLGQWASLAELLGAQISQGERESTPTPAASETAAAPTEPPPPEPAAPPQAKPGTYVYVIRAPGLQLDGCASELYAPNPQVAREKADAHARTIGDARLEYVGIWIDPTSDRHRRFECGVPYDEAPQWAKEWLDAQVEALAKTTTRRARKVKAA
jgi:hypothetical protein